MCGGRLPQERHPVRLRAVNPLRAVQITVEHRINGDHRISQRAADALYAAHAGVRGMRWLAGGLLEVRYDLDGERFVSIVEGSSLNVVDAGICLSGRDRDLTLDSLPSAIREAAGSGRLNITAW